MTRKNRLQDRLVYNSPMEQNVEKIQHTSADGCCIHAAPGCGGVVFGGCQFSPRGHRPSTWCDSAVGTPQASPYQGVGRPLPLDGVQLFDMMIRPFDTLRQAQGPLAHQPRSGRRGRRMLLSVIPFQRTGVSTPRLVVSAGGYGDEPRGGWRCALVLSEDVEKRVDTLQQLRPDLLAATFKQV